MESILKQMSFSNPQARQHTRNINNVKYNTRMETVLTGIFLAPFMIIDFRVTKYIFRQHRYRMLPQSRKCER